jgi:hypothetical protein
MMTDELLRYGTILNSRAGTITTLTWVLMAWWITWRKRRTEDNVATPEVHQRGEDVMPLPT